MPGYFISFEDDGTVGDEFKSKTKEKFSQLEIQLVNILKSCILLEFIFFKFLQIAYGPGIQPEKDDHTIETSNEASPPSYWAAAASAGGSTSPTSNRQSHIGDNASSPS